MAGGVGRLEREVHLLVAVLHVCAAVGVGDALPADAAFFFARPAFWGHRGASQLLSCRNLGEIFFAEANFPSKFLEISFFSKGKFLQKFLEMWVRGNE